MHPRCGQLALNESGGRTCKGLCCVGPVFPALGISFVAGDSIPSNIGSSAIGIEHSLQTNRDWRMLPRASTAYRTTETERPDSTLGQNTGKTEPSPDPPAGSTSSRRVCVRIKPNGDEISLDCARSKDANLLGVAGAEERRTNPRRGPAILHKRRPRAKNRRLAVLNSAYLTALRQ